MSLGYIFRQRRTELELSQPELAERAGIEQSYLSKLENDHSLPSDDILLRILNALGISVEQLCRQLDLRTINPKILSIPSIEQCLRKQQKRNRRSELLVVLISSLLIALAVPLFYAGYTGLFFPSTQYTYVSQGKIPPDQPLDYFENGWSRELIIDGPEDERRQPYARTIEAENIMLSHVDYHYIQTFSNLPAPFIEIQPSGLLRVYSPATKPLEIKRPANAWLQVSGLFLFTLGIMGLIGQRLLTKRKPSLSS